MGRPLPTCLILLFLAAHAQAQTFSITGGSGAGCQGILYDSGGEGAIGYQNNESYTFTLCPDIPGNVIYLTFFNFNLNTSGPNPVDNLTIYDGDNTGALTLGTYTGTGLQNIIVSGTVLNTTGCLTLVFNSNGNGTGVFAAGFQCTTPCEHPTAVAQMSEAAPALVCVDEPVTFDGSASFPTGGFAIQQYLWDFDDGTLDSTSGPIVQHAFASDGEYVVQLTVTDDNDCHNLNLVDLQVLVSTTPDFSQTDPSTEVCFGETVTLHGHGEPVTWTGIPEANFGNGVFLPDNVGQPFTSTLLFEQFDPGQLVTSTTNILSICVDMEHTFMGDLLLQVICPNGQTTIFHQQGGGGTYIGAPNDMDSDAAPVFGECWHYCWSPTATNGTWIENLANTTVAGTPPAGSINPGTYESLQSFNNLIGCPLNGEWTFQSTDLWAIDNGFICGWEINFDPGIIPDLTQFTPSWGPDADSSLWIGGTQPDGISANGDDITFTATAPGTYPFIYSVTDNFGCTYDTTILVIVDEPFDVDAGLDAVICNDPVQLEASIIGMPTTCDWVLQLDDSWGDGWNGAQLTVTIDGVASSYTVPFGTANTVVLSVSGGDIMSLTYSPGTFENEVTYTLTDDQGNTVFSDGPFPAMGAVWNGTTTCNDVGGMIWSWSPSAGLSDPTIPDPLVAVSSPTTYTVTASIAGHPACQASDDVNVTVDPGADPGLDTLIIICPGVPAFTMVDMLGGTPVNNGVWTDTNGQGVPGQFDPGVDLPGIYTYTATSALGCIGTAQLEIQVLNANDPLCCGSVDAGTDGAITLCSIDAAADLFTQLGGTPNSAGTWTDPVGAPHSGLLDPGIDAPGSYAYTVTGGPNCPPATAIVVVNVPVAPDAGPDGAVLICASEPSTDLALALPTADAGGAWTDPQGLPTTGLFDPAVDATGVYTYTVTGAAPCPADMATVDVSVSPVSNPGTDGSAALCSADAVVDLFTLLGGTPDPNGMWTGPDGLPNTGIIDPATDPPGDHIYTVLGITPCPDASSTISITVAQAVDAGINGATTLCTTEAQVDLFTSLGGTPDANGAWTFAGSAHSGTFSPGDDAAGTYTYSVTAIAPCPDATATVDVALTTPPNAGGDAEITLCVDGAMVDLFTLLGADAEPGGTWSAPDGMGASGIFTPSLDPPGDYTYSVPGMSPCPADEAVVAVMVIDPPDAGTDGALTLCATAPPTDLFAALGGTPDVGGSWSVIGVAHGSSFDPATDAPGDYSYTVLGTHPCPAAIAVVSVTVATEPDAGTNGLVTLCASSSAIGLFAQLGGTPDAGGSWTGPSPVTDGVFDPANMLAGSYTYMLDGQPPCPDASSNVEVVLVSQPDAGADGELLLCATGTSADLFSALGGTPDAAGTWTDPQGNAYDGEFSPGQDQPGSYTYIVDGTTPCPADEATVAVAVVTEPDAGLNGTTTLCAIDASISLFALLGGTPDIGGTWTGPSVVADGTFDPAVMLAGSYTYTVDAPAPCTSASSEVMINVVMPAHAGSDGELLLCISSPPSTLFNALDGTPDPGGSWTGPDGAPHAGVMNPAVDMPGVYTYTDLGIAPCPADESTVSVAVVTSPDAGVGGAATLCATDAPIGLFALLGGTPDIGGMWNGPSAPINGTFDPAAMLPGIYTYTVAAPTPCVSVSSTVTIAVVVPAQAGSDAELLLCITSPPSALFDALGNAPDTGGSWTDPTTAPHVGVINPSLDPPGAYTYTVAGTTPCPNDAAIVHVTIVTNPDAGGNGAITTCATGMPFDLSTWLEGSPDAGGTWTGPSPVIDGSFDPGSMTAGTYTYTINVPLPCTSVSSTVVVAVVEPPNAGSPGELLLCTSSPATDLFTALTGTPAIGGTWTAPDGSPHTGSFEPGVDAPGIYVYSVHGTQPCPAASSTVTVVVSEAPTAGLDNSLNVCITGDGIDLAAHLVGADPGGAWTNALGQPHSGLFLPGSDVAGGYTYTISGVAPCPSDAAMITVAVLSEPDAGEDGALVLCTDAALVDLVDQLGGTPDAGGLWYGPDGPLSDGQFNAADHAPGTYAYIVAVPLPCLNDTAAVVVQTLPQVDAGTDGSATLCADAGVLPLFTLLGGTPQAGGAWTAPDGTAHSGSFLAGESASGIYTYTLIATTPCPDQQATVTMTVSGPIIATANITDAVCNGACDGSATLMVTGGNGGYTFVWSGNVAGAQEQLAMDLCAGSYSTTITDSLGCAGSVQFAVDEPPALVIDDVLTVAETCPGYCDGVLHVVDDEGVLYSTDGGAAWQALATFPALCAGVYGVLMQDANGCIAEAAASVASPPPVVAAFTPMEDTITIEQPLVHFVNQSARADSFHWFFGDLGESTLGNPSFIFPNVVGGSYEVCLEAYNDVGCSDSVCQWIHVLDVLLVHAPNAFTPDGDGVNDSFTPVFNLPATVSNYELLIFNRWGERIFDTRSVGSAWDGTLNGELVQPDVYVWKLSARDIVTRRTLERIGSITVVR